MRPVKRASTAIFVALALLAAGCGDDDDEATITSGAATAETTTSADGPAVSDASGFKLVEECAELTGQEITAPPPGNPAFVECLEESGAPADTVAAWKP